MALRRKKVQWFEDTAANWTAENPILPASWAGVESDTGQTKLGDGATAWNSLSYSGGGGGGGSETTTTLGALVNGATAKATPVDADMLPLMDSAASNVVKKLSWANVKAAILAYIFPTQTAGGVLFADGSAALAQDNATLLYDNTDKTLKLLESGYNVATAGWSSASKAALQIGNNNTPHTFGSDPGFFGQKIDIYGAASSGNSKQLSGIRVRAQFAATGTSNGHTTTAIEAFVSNPDDTTANANALLQALEGIVQATKTIGRAAGGYFVVNAGGAANPTVTTQYGVFSQIGNAGAFSTTDAVLFNGWAVTGSGVVTNLYGLRLAGWSGSGVVNSYGIYIEASIDLGTTLKYAFYSLSTSPSLFSGPVSGVINAYDATSWNGSAKFATEDAIRDKIESLVTLIGLLDQAEVLKGTWDASAGTFPGAGAAQAGWKYIVSVGGTVDSVVFNVGDRIVAILDNASTSTFAANWFKEDFTDLVSSVNGQVGAVSLLVSEVDGDSTLPGTAAIGEIRTLQNGKFYHASAANTWDQILKASNIGGTRAVTGTSDTILVADFSKIVTFTNAAAIAVTLPQAGAGSPAEFVDKWYATFVNIGPSKVTITPTTSTIGGAATLQLGPGQAALVWSNGTNYLCVVVDSMKIGIACSDETTAITTGTAKATFRMPCAMKLLAVRASVTTAPTGSTILIDINEGGTTVLSTKLMIDASEKTSTTAATPAVISDAVLADDAEITIDFDQVGSTIAGAGVKVWLIGIPG